MFKPQRKEAFSFCAMNMISHFYATKQSDKQPPIIIKCSFNFNNDKGTCTIVLFFCPFTPKVSQSIIIMVTIITRSFIWVSMNGDNNGAQEDSRNTCAKMCIIN